MINIDELKPAMTVKARYQEYPGGPWVELDLKEETIPGLKTEVKPCHKYQTQD